MNHVVFYSGGIGSWKTAERVKEKYGIENLYLIFTDTLYEDEDLYRFLVETVCNIYEVDVLSAIELIPKIPPVWEKENRLKLLRDIAGIMAKEVPNFKWLIDGRDIWDVFKDVNFLGNSRIAHCSYELKQRAAKQYIKKHYRPEDTTLYLGIDWTEEHRTKAPTKNWHPYKVEYPMLEEPFLSKSDMLNDLSAINIQIPRLYRLGFSHNNCSGFCVRAGQGHFINLLNKFPDRYRYAEEQEQALISQIGKDVSILKKTLKGKNTRYTLKQLREDYEKYPKQNELFDLLDIGGCGCFSVYND
jgi:hypothetical protein